MVEKGLEGMDSSSSGSAEDVVQALLDYLVDPMLPLKSAGREVPSLAQQQLVAKQVHAVVLLYNYYQRKQHPEVEILGFESFSKLAVILKPTMMAHMKLMHQSDYTDLDDLEDQLSMTEKAIMNACDISLVLDASKDVPSTEGWRVSKVAVLLTDSSKENCLLQFSSVTHGVWSVIEKDLDISSVSSEGIVEGKQINKRKRNPKKPLRDEANADETGFRQLALSSVKEVTGIDQSDLMVLESHVVYSLSKEKTAAHFYIMQCTKSINEDLKVPIKDVISSLQGPLVRKSSGSWTVTPVVEYFHVLPYAAILTDWFSRENTGLSVGLENADIKSSQSQRIDSSLQDLSVGLGNGDVKSSERIDSSLQDLSVGLGNVDVKSSERIDSSLQDLSMGLENADDNSSQRIDNLCDKEVTENRDDSNNNCDAKNSIGNKARGINTESLKQSDNNGSSLICFSASSSGPQNMDADDSSVVCRENENRSKSTRNIIKVYHHQKRTTNVENNINSKTSGPKMGMVDSVTKSCSAECKDEKEDTGKKTSSIISSDQDKLPTGDHALVSSQPNSKCLEKLQVTLASKENTLSQAALKVLRQRRCKLSRQLRDLEDEIAVCDKNIQSVLDGGEDGLALKIEAIIDACNDLCLKSETETQDRNDQPFDEQGSPQYRKRKRLCEAVLTVQKSCQELDDICCKNNWTLPTYHVSPADGGFRANVTVKGVDFECSGGSDLCSSCRLARESAAAQMIVKLRNMAGQSQ